jgi:hypothetical protein
MNEPSVVPYERFLEYQEQRRRRRELADAVRAASDSAAGVRPTDPPTTLSPPSDTPETVTVAPLPAGQPADPVSLLVR